MIIWDWTSQQIGDFDQQLNRQLQGLSPKFWEYYESQLLAKVFRLYPKLCGQFWFNAWCYLHVYRGYVFFFLITPTAPQALLPSGSFPTLDHQWSRISRSSNCKQAWAIRPFVAPGRNLNGLVFLGKSSETAGDFPMRYWSFPWRKISPTNPSKMRKL